MRAPPSRPHLTLIIPQRPHPQVPSPWESRLQHGNLGRTQFSPWKPLICNYPLSLLMLLFVFWLKYVFCLKVLLVVSTYPSVVVQYNNIIYSWRLKNITMTFNESLPTFIYCDYSYIWNQVFLNIILLINLFLFCWEGCFIEVLLLHCTFHSWFEIYMGYFYYLSGHFLNVNCIPVEYKVS